MAFSSASFDPSLPAANSDAASSAFDEANAASAAAAAASSRIAESSATWSGGVPKATFTQDDGVIVGTGAGTYQEETGATLRTSVGLGTGDSPTFTALTLSNGQIAFPATAVPSVDPNTLDDYEEGTHEVTITCATSGSYTLATDSNLFGYTKIGRIVTIHGYLSITGETSPSGDLHISIPFTGATLTEGADNICVQAAIYNHGGDLPGVHGYIRRQSYIQLLSVTDAGIISIVDEASVDSAWACRINATYIAA